MSDTPKANQSQPYSVRTTNEVMADITTLVEKTGLSQKDLLSAMVTQFKSNLLAGGDSEQTEDMQQLRYHLTHAESIFVNMTQKLHDLKDDYSGRIEQEKRLHQNIIDQVDRSRQQAEAERDKAKEDLAGIQEQIKELSERNAELETVNKSNLKTIELLTNQNDSLEARIGTVAEMETEVTQLRAELAAEQKRSEKLQAEAEKSIREMESKEQAITSMKTSHAGELASSQKMAELQIHAATVEANNRVLEATTRIKDEYAAKIETLQERIHTLTARVHELELLK
ncbi:hypothetical protein [Desulfitobacterium chlororespirans]|uniref:Replication region DNA-binding N-term n=1 Tax=Desulfitobacterium chlororespirans DSM 11544 TaxID=1121395 RepID=A0A1M7UP10_9FIRM|nr:hypothetical protein [Desulfitobacterium chlororespirans]SHN84742.1 hypothetical protein SAMN02745215_04268 [Desulfitobacterium chlororespirans DSM 11544]